MNNLKSLPLIIFVLILSTGCANLKYPNWEQVNITSTVNNQPCISVGTKEQCQDSKSDCVIWFKKRATIVDANTTVMLADDSTAGIFTGKYFQCKAGLPLYKSQHFNREGFVTGINTVTGQAFLRQVGGGVVTCAGETVTLHPDFDAYDISEVEMLDSRFNKTGQCDAQGNFEFNNIPAGNWVISVKVSWDVYNVGRQGGSLTKSVTVKDGEANKFIISQ